MFNRTIQVKTVKTKKDADDPTINEDTIETYAFASAVAKDIIREAGKVTAAIILLDTFRKVAIILAERE